LTALAATILISAGSAIKGKILSNRLTIRSIKWQFAEVLIFFFSFLFFE
jgi:hypothetical protein